MAAIEPERILQIVQPFAGHFITAIGQPAVRLEQNGRAEELVAVPPIAGTSSRAAGAQNTFIQPVQLFTLFWRLKPLLTTWRGADRLQPRPDRSVLCVKMGEVRDKILDDFHVRQRRDAQFAFDIIDRRRAGEAVLAIHVHGARSANPLTARPAKGECRINLVLYFEQSVENHRAAAIKIHFEGVVTRVLTTVRIVAIDLESFDARRAFGLVTFPGLANLAVLGEGKSGHGHSILIAVPGNAGMGLYLGILVVKTSDSATLEPHWTATRLSVMSDDTGWPKTAAIFGATGGIGRALGESLLKNGIERLHVGGRSLPQFEDQRVRPFAFDLLDEASIKDAVGGFGEAPELVVVATGVLTLADGGGPEKSLRALSPDQMAQSFAINTIGPALVAKHVLPTFPRSGRHVFAALSARVGSIGDNRIGGWHSYRASKGALNMLIRNFAIEMQRTRPEVIVAGLHPGTVDTKLSEPFQGNVPSEQLFTPRRSANALLDVINGLLPADSGSILAWDGKRIAD